MNGSFVDQVVFGSFSNRFASYSDTWSHSGDNGLDNDDPVFGSVALQRDRLDLKVENEEVWFIREYWSDELNEWVREGTNKSRTNEQGVADFEWASWDKPATEYLVRDNGELLPTTPVQHTLKSLKPT